jgi:hypothetical protein
MRHGPVWETFPPYGKWRDARSVDPFSSGVTIFDNQVVIMEYAA